MGMRVDAKLQPGPRIEFHVVLDSAAQESSNAWNNVGTGHAELCELNEAVCPRSRMIPMGDGKTLRGFMPTRRRPWHK